MKKSHLITTVIYAALASFMASSYLLIRQLPWLLLPIIPLYLSIHLLAGTRMPHCRSKRLNICAHGTLLLSCFYASAITSVIFHTFLALQATAPTAVIASALFSICANALLWLNGMACVLLSSTQLGIKKRVLGMLLGPIPLINIPVLTMIIHTTAKECLGEAERERRDRLRASEKVCATKYPILLVHGVFFRDSKHFNYWGRIPEALARNGAQIYYGEHQSAASIADSAAELKARIEAILAQTGAEKVNIIAHSKGGLDCRYAISQLGIAPMVASLTTINTPHRGCLFADHLLEKVPQKMQRNIAATYETALKRLGDPSPDFMAAVTDLTYSACLNWDRELTVPKEVYCQSVGSILEKASGGSFPLNHSYHLAKHFDGPNDGLVGVHSFQWGDDYTLLTPPGHRGISHADMIDLTRKDIDGFDVREFYVSLVSRLKAKGL